MPPELQEAYDAMFKKPSLDDDAAMPTTPEAIEALTTPAAERTSAHVRRIYNATRHVKFFKMLDDKALHEALCRALTLEKVDNGHVVCEQGEQGSRFYVILSGSCRVLKHYGTGGGEGTPVGMLHEGDAFGELALLGDGTRSATVEASSPSTQLLCLERDDYKRTLSRRQASELDTRAHFLGKSFLFTHWPAPDRRKLGAVLSTRTYPPHSVILQQGTATDCFYLVLSGRCRVLQRIELGAAYESQVRVHTHTHTHTQRHTHAHTHTRTGTE